MRVFNYIVIVLLLSVGLASAQRLDEMIETVRKEFDTVLNTPGKMPAELQPLYIMLIDPEPMVRIRAAQGLALRGGPTAALLLARAMDDSLESSTAVRIEAARGLGEVGGQQALKVLGIGLKDPDATVRMRVIESLRWAGTVFAVPYINIALNGDVTYPGGTPTVHRPKDPVLGVRMQAVRMLRKIGTQFSEQPLSDALAGPNKDKDPAIRKAAADALGEIGKKERDIAKKLEFAYSRETDLGVKLEIIGSLGLVRDRAGLPGLQIAMQDRNVTLRMRATQVYGRVIGLQ